MINIVDLKHLKKEAIAILDIPFCQGTSFFIQTKNACFEIKIKSNNHFAEIYDTNSNFLFKCYLTQFNKYADEWYFKQQVD